MSVSPDVKWWISIIVIVAGFIGTNAFQKAYIETIVATHLENKAIHIEPGVEFTLDKQESLIVGTLAQKGYPFTAQDRKDLASWIVFNENWKEEVGRIIEKTIIEYEKRNR